MELLSSHAPKSMTTYHINLEGVARDESQVSAWQEFCTSLNLPAIAIIYSDYSGKADRIETESPLLTGSVHYLERGEDVSTRPMVRSLAKLLVNLAR